MQEIPYSHWREYDPEDTVRFYALRLHEVGMIKSSPQKIIAEGTDWRFFNELKKELKAAICALESQGIKRKEWTHKGVHSDFVLLFVRRRRKIVPASFVSALPSLMQL